MQVVAPKRISLGEANKKLEGANKKLSGIRAHVAELRERVASLEASLMKVCLHDMLVGATILMQLHVNNIIGAPASCRR